MISNPCTWFAGGGSRKDQRSFTYEGGSTLYHFSTNMVPHERFSHWIPVNVVFFANDKKHALDVLIRMFNFAIECKAEYIAYQSGRGKNAVHSEEFRERAERDSEVAMIILSALHSGTVEPEIAPTNQFYKVGWACNDTLF